MNEKWSSIRMTDEVKKYTLVVVYAEQEWIEKKVKFVSIL